MSEGKSSNEEKDNDKIIKGVNSSENNMMVKLNVKDIEYNKQSSITNSHSQSNNNLSIPTTFK